MSKARLEIISNIKNDPENTADSFIQLQKELFELQEQLEQKDKEIEAYKFNIQGEKNAVRELSDMGALLHTKNKELKARNEKLERVVDNFTDRYKLGDSIRQAYLKHGNDSWCSIADDVIKELKDD